MESTINFIEVPVFRPNKKEFADFSSMINRIETDPRALAAGLAKVIPPVEMKPKLVHSRFKLENCFVQEISKFGDSTDMYILDYELQKSMTVSKFKDHVAKNHVNTNNVEDSFWCDILKRNSKPPIYPVDNDLSLYPDDWSYWRMNALTQNQSIIHQVGLDFKGINTSFLYFGMMFTAFGIHHEDSNLGSLNILHGGAPKTWYGIASSYASAVEQLANEATPKDILCDYFIRHKRVLIPPSVLQRNGIEFSKVVQEPGDMIVTLYNCYHQGFNNGFNWAEACNFATSEWLKYYDKTKLCTCDPYGKEARSRHEVLGTIIEDWNVKFGAQNNNNILVNLNPSENSDARFDSYNHWINFDDNFSRSRCKLPGCNGFTHAFCSKCNKHFCCKQDRNCFLAYHNRGYFPLG